MELVPICIPSISLSFIVKSRLLRLFDLVDVRSLPSHTTFPEVLTISHPYDDAIHVNKKTG